VVVNFGMVDAFAWCEGVVTGSSAGFLIDVR
jgi:hypothetical protein